MATEAAYSDETIQAVLNHAQTHGIVEAAQHHNIHRVTVWRWMRKHGLLATVAPKQTAGQVALREELREAMLEQAVALVERMDAEPKASACRDYSIAVGVLLDKYRLEMGEATERTERGVDWDAEAAKLASNIVQRDRDAVH